MTIGEKIKLLRIALNLTQEELALSAGTTKQTIYKYETGIVSNIPVSKIKAISDKLQTSPAYLMGWNTENLSESEFELLQVFQKLTVAGKDKVIDFANMVYTAEQTNKTSITSR